ncbi:dienelactone hydrolase family protein [Mesorhizobium sp. M0830]|uniref:dienelactone hydrolase family protein n=1 Tax=Mesorhizobium sp. M0830 TaxID=2957008 RepID=UPI00333A5DF2
MTLASATKHAALITAAVVFGAAGVMLVRPSWSAAAPPMGGGYTNVIPIPVNDPAVKEIAGALFKPQGTGPFPVVVYMPPCGGPNFPPEFQQEKFVTERLLSKGVAIFIVDTHTPRGENDNCAKFVTVLADVQNRNQAVLQLITQGGVDAVAAVKVVKAMPDIDPKKVFLMGFSAGATAALYATDPNAPGAHDTSIAGVVAYYPLCYENAKASAPTLILIGDKDDWTGPVAACQALEGKTNFEVLVYPGVTHSFTMPFEQPFDLAGHHLAYDEAATKQAAEQAEAFIAAHLK